jgi:hypothetical protein
MAVDITKLVAAISPNIYCKEFDTKGGKIAKPVRSKVKKILEEGLKNKDPQVYLKAAKEAQLIDGKYMDIDEAENWMRGAYLGVGQNNPMEKHLIEYDNIGGSLESIYFWILDYLKIRSHTAEKLVDTFLASPGSANFAEMGGRLTRMQEEGMKMLGAANQVVKSIINILYDLKEFKMRLATYKDYKSENPAIRHASLLSLKQIWMDTVDMKRGNSSIKAMAQQFDYVTLIDAFMATTDLEQIMKKPEEGGLDLNDRVRRILEQRLQDFYRWVKESELELRKRYEIEKIYLKSQVNTVKMYARWAKPYLRFAKQLEPRMMMEPDVEPNAASTTYLVNAFNTTLMQLTILALRKYEPTVDIGIGHLPEMLRFKLDECRDYYSCTLLDYKFRAYPERFGQGGYGMRGRLELNWYSFCLNKDELKVLRREIEKDDFGDIYQAITGATDDSLGLIQKEIDEFLDETGEEDKEEPEDVNPFSALIGKGGKSGKKSKKDKDKKDEDPGPPIPSDKYIETGIRCMSIIESRKECRRAYNLFKRAFGMAAFNN